MKRSSGRRKVAVGKVKDVVKTPRRDPRVDGSNAIDFVSCRFYQIRHESIVAFHCQVHWSLLKATAHTHTEVQSQFLNFPKHKLIIFKIPSVSVYLIHAFIYLLNKSVHEIFENEISLN